MTEKQPSPGKRSDLSTVPAMALTFPLWHGQSHDIPSNAGLRPERGRRAVDEWLLLPLHNQVQLACQYILQYILQLKSHHVRLSRYTYIIRKATRHSFGHGDPGLHFADFESQAPSRSAAVSDWLQQLSTDHATHGVGYCLDRCLVRMPAIPSEWMDSAARQLDGLDPWTWAAHAHHLVAPRVTVSGRMALIVAVVVLWASFWLETPYFVAARKKLTRPGCCTEHTSFCIRPTMSSSRNWGWTSHLSQP